MFFCCFYIFVFYVLYFCCFYVFIFYIFIFFVVLRRFKGRNWRETSCAICPSVTTENAVRSVWFARGTFWSFGSLDHRETSSAFQSHVAEEPVMGQGTFGEVAQIICQLTRDLAITVEHELSIIDDLLTLRTLWFLAEKKTVWFFWVNLIVASL